MDIDPRQLSFTFDAVSVALAQRKVIPIAVAEVVGDRAPGWTMPDEIEGKIERAEKAMTAFLEKGISASVSWSGQLVIDYQLVIDEVSLATASSFVTEHHRYCKRPAGWRFGACIRNGDEMIGVVMVGRPVARMLDKQRVVEVNRLCIRTDIASALAWNACSQLYGWAAREALKRGFEKVLTYTRADESGASLKAAGWVVEHKTKGRHWGTENRPRDKSGTPIDKFRWTPAAMLGIDPGLKKTVDLNASV